MRFKLRAELILGQRTVLDLWTLIGGLADGSGVETKLDLLATLVVCDVGRGNAFHAEDPDFVAVTARQSVLDAGETVERRWL